jgi:hypothetical protein
LQMLATVQPLRGTDRRAHSTLAVLLELAVVSGQRCRSGSILKQVGQSSKRWIDDYIDLEQTIDELVYRKKGLDIDGPEYHASLRGGVERAAHLPRDALHGAGAYANFAGNLVDAFTCAPAMIPDDEASARFLDRPGRREAAAGTEANVHGCGPS